MKSHSYLVVPTACLTHLAMLDARGCLMLHAPSAGDAKQAEHAAAVLPASSQQGPDLQRLGGSKALPQPELVTGILSQLAGQKKRKMDSQGS